MPYLRLYSPEIPVERKVFIAQKLIEITLRTFHLRPAERNRITIQFIPLSKEDSANLLQPSIPSGADLIFEVMGHDLTETKKREFAEEATSALSKLMPPKSRGRIARLLGIKADAPRQIAFQFGELSPAVSEPFVLHPDSAAA